MHVCMCAFVGLYTFFFKCGGGWMVRSVLIHVYTHTKQNAPSVVVVGLDAVEEDALLLLHCNRRIKYVGIDCGV